MAGSSKPKRNGTLVGVEKAGGEQGDARARADGVDGDCQKKTAQCCGGLTLTAPDPHGSYHRWTGDETRNKIQLFFFHF